MLDDSVSYKHTAIFGLKKAVDHVTVVCCSYVSGTDKKTGYWVKG
jgi:hypothetical protein